MQFDRRICGQGLSSLSLFFDTGLCRMRGLFLSLEEQRFYEIVQ